MNIDSLSSLTFNSENSGNSKKRIRESHPVVKLESIEDTTNNPAEVSELLSDGFKWDEMNEIRLDEVSMLLQENWSCDDDNDLNCDGDSKFRLVYTPNVLKWLLKLESSKPSWNVGVRTKAANKLVGFICAIPTRLRIYDKEFESANVDFWCVDKNFRSKRIGAALREKIKERVSREGIDQVVCTSTLAFDDKPFSKCRFLFLFLFFNILITKYCSFKLTK